MQSNRKIYTTLTNTPFAHTHNHQLVIHSYLGGGPLCSICWCFLSSAVSSQAATDLRARAPHTAKWPLEASTFRKKDGRIEGKRSKE